MNYTLCSCEVMEGDGWLHPTGVISLVSGPDSHSFAYWN